jgi:predicted Zn-dependent protease
MRLQAIIPALLSLTLAAKAQTYSTEKEIILGAQLAAQLRQDTTPLNLPAAENYATNIGLRLAPYLPNSPIQWRFTVIRNSQPGRTQEPIALPGGWIFIPAQLILSAHTESEFAAMLAHAMAHVALRQMTNQVSGDNASIPVIFVGIPTQPKFELEADQTALQALANAGFDPSSLLSYLQRTSPQRIDSLKQTIQAQPPALYIVSTDLFQSIQEQVQHELSARLKAHIPPSLFNQ